MHIRISRKEAKESRLYLSVLDPGYDPATMRECQDLIQESTELMLVFGAILRKTE